MAWKPIGWGRFHRHGVPCPQPECQHTHTMEEAAELNRLPDKVRRETEKQGIPVVPKGA